MGQLDAINGAPGRPVPSDPDAAARKARALARLATLGGDGPRARIDRLMLARRWHDAGPGRWDDLPLARVLNEADTLSASAAAREVRRGERSPERVAIEVAGPLIDAAASWADLHVALAREGIAYRRKGSGAVLLVGGVAVKASTCRRAALGPLTDRLGAYRSAPDEATGDLPSRRAEAAPGTDPRVYAALRHDRAAIAQAQAAFAAACTPLPPASWRAEALFGARPRAASDARTTADRLGVMRPRLDPIAHPDPPPLDPTSALADCHAALRAEGYGVLIRMPKRKPAANAQPAAAEAGARPADEPYDRLLHVPFGPLAAVQAAWPRIKALVRQGGGVELLIADRRQHHVVLRDLDADGLARLRADGYAAALVLETRPGWYEAVMRAPRGETVDGPAAARRVGLTLARRYGCTASASGIRLARGPRLGEIGTGRVSPPESFVTKLVAWSGAVCGRLATLIDRTTRSLRAVRTLTMPAMPGLRSGAHAGERERPTAEQAAIYHAHRRDLVAGWEARAPDGSRVDARIACRLRATGHGEAAVAVTIAACAAAVEPLRRRDWAAYGRRAASLAFAQDAPILAESQVDAGRVTAWMALERRTRERLAALTALRDAPARRLDTLRAAPEVATAGAALDAPDARPSSSVVATPLGPTVGPTDVQGDGARSAGHPPSGGRRLGAIETVTEIRPAGLSSDPSPTPPPPGSRPDGTDCDRRPGHGGMHATVPGADLARDPMVPSAQTGLAPHQRPPGDRAGSSDRLGAFELIEREIERAKRGGGRDVPEISTVLPFEDGASEVKVLPEPKPEPVPVAAPARDMRRVPGPADPTVGGHEGFDIGIRQIGRASHPRDAPAADRIAQRPWDPLTDVRPADRLAVGYFLMAVESRQHTVQRWRPYLRQALGKDLSARLQAWHERTRDTEERASAQVELRRWAGGWNFNAVDRICTQRGVKTPDR